MHKTKTDPTLPMLQYKPTSLILIPGHTHTHIMCGLYPETSALQALFNHVGLAALITMSTKVSPCCYLLFLQLLQHEEHALQVSLELALNAVAA